MDVMDEDMNEDMNEDPKHFLLDILDMARAPIDLQTLLLIGTLSLIAYWIYNRTTYAQQVRGSGAKWGPLAGSGPGINPDVTLHTCPAHAQQRKRDQAEQNVAPYNPKSFDFASVQ